MRSPIPLFLASTLLFLTITASSEPLASTDSVRAGYFPSDEEFRKEIPSQSNRELFQFYQIYHRLAKTEISEALLAEARRRDPKLAERLLESTASGMPNPERIKIDKLFDSKQYKEAIAWMENLRQTRYCHGDFPYERQVADAFGAMGNESAEKQAWLRVLFSKASSTDDQLAARKALEAIRKQEVLRKGYILLQDKHYEEAQRTAERELRQSPEDKDFRKLRYEAVLNREIDGVEHLIRDPKKNRKEALIEAEKLLRKYPKETEVRLLWARALVCACRFEEALPELEQVKSTHYGKKPFPGEFDLAESYAAIGEFEKAVQSYELATSDPLMTQKDVLNAQRASQSLAHKLMSRLSGTATYREEGTGKMLDFHSDYSHFLSSQRQAGVRLQAHEITLNPASLIRQEDSYTWGGEAFVHERFGKRGFVEGWLGSGSFGGASGGVALGRHSFHSSQPSDLVQVVLRTPSLDSIQLAALDAVKDSVEYIGTRQLTPKTTFVVNASISQVAAEDVRIGKGCECSLEVKQTLFEKPDSYGLSISYRGIHEGFTEEWLDSADLTSLRIDPFLTQNPGNQFYEPAYDPHGLQLSAWWEPAPVWLLYGSIGKMYDFADEIFSLQASGGFVWQAAKNAEIEAEAGYYSDGTGAASGGGSVVVGTLGMQLFF